MHGRIFVGLVILSIAGLTAGQENALARYQEYSNKASQALQRQDYGAALEYFSKQLEMIPDKPDLNYKIAQTCALMGDSQKALAFLEKALTLGHPFENELDKSFDGLRESPGFSKIQALMAEQRKPVSHSRTAFTISEKDLLPEGLAYDPLDDYFYLGSLWKCKIVRIDRRGRVSDFTDEKQDGLRSVAGIKVDPERRVLWAASFVGQPWSRIAPEEIGWSGLFKYDLKTGKLLKKYTLSGKSRGHLFNDLTITRTGDVFITDTSAAAIYVVFHDKDELEVFLESGEFMYPNGIALGKDDLSLYMAASNGAYYIDIPKKTCKPIANPDDMTLSGVDGMYYYQNSLVCVQNRLNRISRFYLNRAGDGAEDLEIIETRNPHFILPTTGCIAGDRFYYIANSQAYSLNQDGTLFPREKLKDIVILYADLKRHL
jgi:sugar lactone lactonase YvrE